MGYRKCYESLKKAFATSDFEMRSKIARTHSLIGSLSFSYLHFLLVFNFHLVSSTSPFTLVED